MRVVLTSSTLGPPPVGLHLPLNRGIRLRRNGIASSKRELKISKEILFKPFGVEQVKHLR